MATLGEYVSLRTKHGALELQVRNQVCRMCRNKPAVAFIEGDYELRCRCWPQPPVLVNETKEMLARREWDMVNKSIEHAKLDETSIRAVRAEALMQEVKNILPGASLCTTAELQGFVRLCQGLGANPFIGDAYLVKYQQGQAAAFVVGLQYVLRQAAQNLAYGGYKAGVVIKGDSDLEYREGSLALPGEQVVGGWCEVHRKGWAVTPRHTVGMAEYNTGRALWKDKAATMIMKTAIKQAVRRAFPEEASEMERQVAAAGVQVMDEDQAGFDMEHTPKLLSPAAAQAAEAPSEDAQAADSGLGQEEQMRPAPRADNDATAFFKRCRQLWPNLYSDDILRALGVNRYTDFKGTVDEALEAVKTNIGKRTPNQEVQRA